MFRMCFSPNGSTNLLVADYHNRKLVEVSFTGEFVRALGMFVYLYLPSAFVTVGGDIVWFSMFPFVTACAPDNTGTMPLLVQCHDVVRVWFCQ